MALKELSETIWSASELLRFNYKQSEFGRVILPFTVLRRLDCLFGLSAALGEEGLESKCQGSAHAIEDVKNNIYFCIQSFPFAIRDMFERFDFFTQIERLARENLLIEISKFFSAIDMREEVVNTFAMGEAFAELIRKFAEISNEQLGEHFTPREVVQLMVSLLFANDKSLLTPGEKVSRTIYDPTMGTGGMLSLASEYISRCNSSAELNMFGQELDDESYAICKASMLMGGKNIDNLVVGNTLSDDGFARQKFDFMLSHPPFGVGWRNIEKTIRGEHDKLKFDGRFGPGLPRLSDGTLLFLLSTIHKMKMPSSGGSRFAVVVTDSVLRSGQVSSGESDIRKWIVENDLLDCIVALPSDIFLNTSVQSYILILDNAKKHDGIKLVNASGMWEMMRSQIGYKRRYISNSDIDKIVRLYHDGTGDHVKIIAKRDLLYRNFKTEIGGNLISRNISLNQNESDYLGATEDLGIDVKSEKGQEIGCEVDFFSFFSNHEAKWASTLPLAALLEVCDANESWDLAFKGPAMIFKSAREGRGELSNSKFFRIRREIVLPRYLEIYINERSIKEEGSSRRLPGMRANLEIRIECPPLKKQQAIVDFYHQKSEFAIRLARIEQEQWEESVSTCIFKQRVSEYGNSVEYMIKIFPHPLASLLYQIQCEREKKDVLEGYRVFFECLGAFLSSIALGVIYECKTEKDCLDVLVNRGRLTRPTMGSYQNILRKSRELGSGIAGYAAYVLSTVASVEVEAILTSCTSIRNEIAHRGLIRSGELGEYIGKFVALLNRVFNAIGDFFAENFVAKQLHQKWNGRAFENEVTYLTGIASYPFERRTKNTSVPLISGELYLFRNADEKNSSDDSLRLFHFVRCVEIVDGSDNEGFYFLNSFERPDGEGKTIFQYSAFQPLIESRKIISSEMLESLHALKSA